MVEKITPYSQVEDEEVSAYELAQRGHKYIIFSLESNFICMKCDKPFTFHKSQKCITFRCGCGCRIFYPKNKDGIRITNLITKDEYKKNGGNSERL